MKVIKSTLLILILLPFASIAKDFQILDYYNGIKIDKLPCKMKLIENWFSSDQYMCSFNNSTTDVIEFQSDFISQEVYQIDRYLLLDISDAKSIAKKIFKKYKNPNSVILDNGFSVSLPIMTWGDSRIRSTSEFSASVVYPEIQGVGLSLQFHKCNGISLGKCRSIFDITTNSPNKIVLNLTVFDAKRHDYSQKVIATGKAPQTKKPAEVEAKKTLDINSLKF